MRNYVFNVVAIMFVFPIGIFPYYSVNTESVKAIISLELGNVKVLRLQDIGMKGNSHMIMQDLNNLEIADMVMEWLKSKRLDN